MRTAAVWPRRAGRTSKGPFSGKPRTAAEVPGFAFTCRAQRRRAADARARAGSRGRCCGSNQIGLRVDATGPSPPSWTVVSSWPATTCAFVTTIPSPGRPSRCPATPSPQAVPSTRTTLRPAARTSRVAGDLRVRRRHVRGAGRGSAGTGRSARARCRIGPDGGSAAFSLWRISERWIGSRSSRAPGVWSATAPAIQTRTSPRQATSTAAAHAVHHAELLREPPRCRWKPSHLEHRREHRAEHQRPDQRERAARRASASPSLRSSGPSREPRNAPRARTRPATAPPAIRPWPKPQTAISDGEGDDDPVEAGQGGPQAIPRESGYAGLPSSAAFPPREEHPPSAPAAHHASRPAHLGGLAAVSLVAGLMVGRARRQRRRAHRVASFAAGLAARRLPRDAPAAHARRPRRAYPLPRVPARLRARRPPRPPQRGSSRTIPRGVRRRRRDRAGRGRHARVRRAARQPRDPGVGRARGLVAAARVPGAAPRRAAHAARACRRGARRIRSRDGKVLARGAGAVADVAARGHRGLDRRAGWSRRRPPRSGSPSTRAASREDWPVGQTGLEEVFEQRLRGRPGGELLAGRARARARQAARPRGRSRPRSTRASRRRP